jgi:hypothetical protein
MVELQRTTLTLEVPQLLIYNIVRIQELYEGGY